jgi:hypothetical protein
LLTLGLAHIATMAVAIVMGWRLENVVWIYWYEGLVAGAFAFMRAVRLPTLGPPAVVAFGLPFCLFHLFYFAFFALGGNPPRLDTGIAVSLSGLVISHSLSYRDAIARDDASPPDLEHFCGFAGSRMLPVMATVAVAVLVDARSGMSSTGQLLIFLSCAAIADLVMQAKERAVRRASPASQR